MHHTVIGLHDDFGNDIFTMSAAEGNDAVGVLFERPVIILHADHIVISHALRTTCVVHDLQDRRVRRE